ncbi:hypothetical protein BDF19DRAFT_437605 [Syncephalis fuscata]|nr:hypothetical protein BDF19DRAFT_437605 [Syncephalis fuscata]
MATSWPWEEHAKAGWTSDYCMDVDDRPRFSTVSPTTTTGEHSHAASSLAATTTAANTTTTTTTTAAITTTPITGKRMRDQHDSISELDTTDYPTNTMMDSISTNEVYRTQSAKIKHRKRPRLTELSGVFYDAVSESELLLSSAASSEPVTPTDWPETLPSMVVSEPANQLVYASIAYNDEGHNEHEGPTGLPLHHDNHHNSHEPQEYQQQQQQRQQQHYDEAFHTWEPQQLASELDDTAQTAWQQVYATSNRILHDAHWTRRLRSQSIETTHELNENHHLGITTTTTTTTTSSVSLSSSNVSRSSSEHQHMLTPNSPYVTFNAMLAQLHRAREHRM